jgi:Xaa-Pro aminopeptidase
VFKDKLPEVRAHLRAENLDGWLLFDFHGTNPFVRRLLGLTHSGLLSRRWFVYVPAEGHPTVTVHAIEHGSFPETGMRTVQYGTRQELRDALAAAMSGAKVVAMEYSPDGNVPYVSRVDGGTIDLVRSLGVNVVSSGDLLQLLMAWSPEQLENHRVAASVLKAAKDDALAIVRARVEAGEPLDEYELQQRITGFIRENGMETDHPPIVAFGRHSADPHYSPAARGSARLTAGPILLDLWCKAPGENYHADITWMAHLGPPAPEVSAAFEAVKRARDTGVEFLNKRLAEGKEVRGHEVDTAVRRVLEDAGFGPRLLHRTGHSLGSAALHGDAAHFDGVETFDERRILPGMGFTIEPGVYLPNFGVRSEINVFTRANGIDITTDCQERLDVL